MTKQISIKVSNVQGNVIKEWSNATFDSFSKAINSGLGECLITLAEKIDYSGSELKLGNGVDIFVADADTITTGERRIYSGYISMIEYVMSGGKESILVHALGHYTKMSVDFLKNGSQSTLYSDSTVGLTTTSPGDAADMGLILRAIIDRYNAETENSKIFYTGVSIPLMSQNILYAMSLKTYREAFDKIISMYAGYSFWYVNEDGLVSAKIKPTTPTHTFQIKKENVSIRIQKSMEKIRNFFLGWNQEPTGSADLVFKHYEDDRSVLQYGRRSDFMADSGVGDEATMDQIGANYIAQNKDSDMTIVCEIADNNIDSVYGYDIESIQPGDTCRFVGLNPGNSSAIDDNMLITKVDYQLDKVVLTIEITKSDIINWQDKTAKEVTDLRSQGSPETYS